MTRDEAETLLETLRTTPVLSREWHRARRAIVDALCGAAPVLTRAHGAPPYRVVPDHDGPTVEVPYSVWAAIYDEGFRARAAPTTGGAAPDPWPRVEGVEEWPLGVPWYPHVCRVGCNCGLRATPAVAPCGGWHCWQTPDRSGWVHARASGNTCRELGTDRPPDIRIEGHIYGQPDTAPASPGESATCPRCGGSGDVCPCAIGAECSSDGKGAACPACHGTGRVPATPTEG
jgi:hypothetical protein